MSDISRSTFVHRSSNTLFGVEFGSSSNIHNKTGRGSVHSRAITSGEETAADAQLQSISARDDAPNGEVGSSRHASRRAIASGEDTAGYTHIQNALSNDEAPNGGV